jgi:hypothetical protein
VVGGGAVAAYVLQQNTAAPVTPGDGALAGLLAGLVGAFVHLFLSIPLTLVMAPMQREIMQRLADSGSVPPAFREYFTQVTGPAVQLTLGFIFMLVVGSIFSTLGDFWGPDLPQAGAAHRRHLLPCRRKNMADRPANSRICCGKIARLRRRLVFAPAHVRDEDIYATAARDPRPSGHRSPRAGWSRRWDRSRLAAASRAMVVGGQLNISSTVSIAMRVALAQQGRDHRASRGPAHAHLLRLVSRRVAFAISSSHWGSGRAIAWRSTSTDLSWHRHAAAPASARSTASCSAASAGRSAIASTMRRRGSSSSRRRVPRGHIVT